MEFKKTLKEEKFEVRGRCALTMSLCVSTPEDETENSTLAKRRIRESLLELSEFALEKAKSRYFEAARECFESCEREGKRFYPYRLSIDISPEKALSDRACVKGKKKRKEKLFSCSDAGCILYKVSLRLFCRGKWIAKEEKRFAFRLCDGYLCGLCPPKNEARPEAH